MKHIISMLIYLAVGLAFRQHMPSDPLQAAIAFACVFVGATAIVIVVNHWITMYHFNKTITRLFDTDRVLQRAIKEKENKDVEQDLAERTRNEPVIQRSDN